MKFAGVIEGFYGRPWSHEQQMILFQWMREWGGFNTYLYAPKDDLKHRKRWRELYSESELEPLRRLIAEADKQNIRFIYAISPGLDIGYSDSGEFTALQNKIRQLLSCGCRHFALLFDDIPYELSAQDRRHFSSFAAAQSDISNRFLNWLEDNGCSDGLIFCPTVYCGQMAGESISTNHYLREIGAKLDQRIDIFWTGPEVVSQEIGLDHIRETEQVLQRKPLIWDNLHANDYDMHRVYTGPYLGRPAAMREHVSGILTNPSSDFWANYIPLRSTAAYVATGEAGAGSELVADWLKFFGDHNFTETEMQLFQDCYYLPHLTGPGAEKIIGAIKNITSAASERILDEFAHTIRAMYEKIAAVGNREIFYSMHRYFWELLRAVRLIEYYRQHPETSMGELAAFDYLPGTSDGGFTGRLLRSIEAVR
jgi:protein O-GlcNAcase/histone acetyltransferase